MGKVEMKLRLARSNDSDGGGGVDSKTVISISSDDEEANEDLSLKIIEKAKLRRCAIVGNSCLSESVEGIADLESEVATNSKDSAKKKKKNEKKSRLAESKDGCGISLNPSTIESTEGNANISLLEQIDAGRPEEDLETCKSINADLLVPTTPTERSDNHVLQKLLRGPRYFDPPSNWGTCYNCGEEGHRAENCASAKRRKPCFVCGSLEHNVKQCNKVKDCFICKQTGHRAKDCPEKSSGRDPSSKVCLKCGDFGHDMFSCKNGYTPDDLKEIQCYICKSFGHLCCVNYTGSYPEEISCYRCGQPGHTGLACMKYLGETTGVGMPGSCFRCGEEGHFARECASSSKITKKNRARHRQSHSEENRYCTEARSAHHDLIDTLKLKKSKQEEHLSQSKSKKRGGWMIEDPEDLPKHRKRGGWITEDPRDLQRSRKRGGWITEDPYDLSHSRKFKANGWRSPMKRTIETPTYRTPVNHNYGGRSDSGHSYWIGQGNSGSSVPPNFYQHRFSATRFGNCSGSGLRDYY